MSTTRHWANAYIGASYEACGGCWGLVRRVFAERFGVQMPEVAVSASEAEQEAQAPAILAASQASGWRPAELPAAEHDILLMRNQYGQRHVGVAVLANGRLGLLHCEEARGAEWVPLDELGSGGYHAIEPWRQTA